MATPPARNASLAFALVVLLLDTLGIGVVIPVMPRLIASFFDGDLAQGSKYYAMFASLYAIMQVLFAPVLGALSDRFGRRPVILLSLLGATCNYLLLAFAPSLAWLFVGRALSGITGASFSAATAYIADVTPPERRAQSFGMVGIAFGLGFIFGPALGGYVGTIHLRAPFMIAAGFNLLNLLYGTLVLPESLAVENRRPMSLARSNLLGSLGRLTRTPILLGLTGTITCAFLAQNILQNTWALHGQSRFGWTPNQVGLSLGVVGISTAIVQGGLVRVLIPKLGERRAVLIGLVCSVLGYVAFGLATEGWMIYALIAPFSLGGLVGPSIQALLSREVLPSEQGELQGSLSSLQSLAAVLGPLIGGGLFSRFAPAGSSPHIPGIAFLASAAINTIGFLLAARLFTKTSTLSPSAPTS